jgi:F-type H+-transporting ATPase subunit epsilon
MLEVQLVSPERILYTGEASMVVCRTIGGGEIGFLTGHTKFIGALDIAKVRIKHDDGSEEVIAVHGGFVEVSDDRVSILSDVAELPEHIEPDRARAALERAEQTLRESSDEETLEQAEAARKRAEVRLEVAGSRSGAATAH